MVLHQQETRHNHSNHAAPIRIPEIKPKLRKTITLGAVGQVAYIGIGIDPVRLAKLVYSEYHVNTNFYSVAVKPAREEYSGVRFEQGMRTMGWNLAYDQGEGYYIIGTNEDLRRRGLSPFLVVRYRGVGNSSTWSTT